MESKICTRCHRELPIEQFRRDIRYAGGRKTWCRDCENAYQVELTHRDIQKRRDYLRVRRQRKKVEMNPPMVIPSGEEIGYMAGAIDFEGTITANNRELFNKKKLAVHYRLMTFNTHLGVLEHLQKIWRGRLSLHGKPRKVNHNQVYNLYWGGKACIPVLKIILPYLLIKKRQAELVMELSELGAIYRPGIPGRFVPPELIPRRQEIINELQVLNHRGNKGAERSGPRGPIKKEPPV